MCQVRVVTVTFLFFSFVSAYDPWEYKSMALRVMRFVSRGAVVTPFPEFVARKEQIIFLFLKISIQPDGLGGHGEAPGDIQN